MKPTAEFLRSLDWRDRSAAHENAAAYLTDLAPESVLSDLRGDLERIDLSRSVEKTTHYKWLLAAPPNEGFELWLHEYKPRELRRTGHATVPHNHRFWLTSLILRGGFTDTRYVRAPGEPAGAAIEPVGNRSLRPGETMVIDPDEIHSLSGLEDGTLSLVVQSEPVRSYSEVFEDGQVRRYSDLEARLAGLRESL